jgi:3-isopropylmalate/(R)-2-methylmalate dehydratase small subunit
MAAIKSVKGTGLPLRGNDLDTDRIMPARFLRAVTFEGLETHLFEDDRAADPSHPFNNPKYTGATVLVVNRNFGCGSSREHAPQGLARYGIRAIVGESYSEIFLGNSAVLGVPCFTADHVAIEELLSLVERAPDTVIDAHVDTSVITAGPLRLTGALQPALRDAFISGQWNPTAMLLERFDEVRSVARKLPYVTGF